MYPTYFVLQFLPFVKHAYSQPLYFMAFGHLIRAEYNPDFKFWGESVFVLCYILPALFLMKEFSMKFVTGAFFTFLFLMSVVFFACDQNDDDDDDNDFVSERCSSMCEKSFECPGAELPFASESECVAYCKEQYSDEVLIPCITQCDATLSCDEWINCIDQCIE